MPWNFFFSLGLGLGLCVAIACMAFYRSVYYTGNDRMRVKYDDKARVGYVTIGHPDEDIPRYTVTLDEHAHIFADYNALTDELVGIEIIE